VRRVSVSVLVAALVVELAALAVMVSGCGGAVASSGSGQTMTDQLAQTQQLLDKANTAIADLNGQVAQIRQQLGNANGTIAEMTSQLSHAQSDANSLRSELVTLKANLGTLGKAYMGIRMTDNQGVYVSTVMSNSPAARAEIPKGCRITHINGRQLI
jgi:septal ring factor EnvC (AmiA/AmiB activator)